MNRNGHMPVPAYLAGLGLGQGQPGSLAAQAIQELGGGDVLTTSFAYDYVFDFTNIAQGGSQTDTNSIDRGSSFLVTEIKLSANYNIANTPTGLAQRAKILRQVTTLPGTPAILADVSYLRIQVTQTDRVWYQSPIRADLGSGDVAAPLILPTPILISEKTTVNVTLFNDLPPLTGAPTPAIDAQYVLGGVWIGNK